MMMTGMTNPLDRMTPVNFTCPSSLMDRVENFAHTHRMTRSAGIRALLAVGLDAVKPGGLGQDELPMGGTR